MITVISNRFESSEQGTFSIWSIAKLNFNCYCAELPWYNNKNSISCIPAGEYIVKIRQSPKYGNIFHVTNVHGRSYILIHSGNYAGDVAKGWKTHSLGCLLIGQKRGIIGNQKAVLNSRITVRRFMQTLNNNTFKLIINETFKKQAA